MEGPQYPRGYPTYIGSISTGFLGLPIFLERQGNFLARELGLEKGTLLQSIDGLFKK